MAKPLGPKSMLIREAIKAHPKLGNKELAEMLIGIVSGPQVGVSTMNLAVSTPGRFGPGVAWL